MTCRTFADRAARCARRTALQPEREFRRGISAGSASGDCHPSGGQPEPDCRSLHASPTADFRYARARMGATGSLLRSNQSPACGGQRRRLALGGSRSNRTDNWRPKMQLEHAPAAFDLEPGNGPYTRVVRPQRSGHSGVRPAVSVSPAPDRARRPVRPSLERRRWPDQQLGQPRQHCEGTTTDLCRYRPTDRRGS